MTQHKCKLMEIFRKDEEDIYKRQVKTIEQLKKTQESTKSHVKSKRHEEDKLAQIVLEGLGRVSITNHSIHSHHSYHLVSSSLVAHGLVLVLVQEKDVC